MAITKAEWNMQCKVTETVALGIDGTPDPVVASETATDASGTLTPSSTIPGTTGWSDTRELAAGTDTLDLSALTKGDLTTAVNLNGLTVQLFKVVAATTNTQSLVVAEGLANPYLIFGTANDQVTIPPGGAVMFYSYDGLLPVVTNTNDEIVVTSAQADAGYDVQIVAG